MHTRRQLLSSAGLSALLFGLAPEAFARLAARDDDDALTFGALEPLVARMESSDPDALVESVVRELRGGAPLERFVAAGALANARTFGGEDYEGYHAFMALMPALAIARELPPERAALPVLKVLHRNTARIGKVGGPRLAPVEAGEPDGLLEASRAERTKQGEEALAGLAQQSLAEAFDALQPLVRDDFEVHRVVLAQRAWEAVEVVGAENATTVLRQVVRFCTAGESRIKDRAQEMRRLVPALADRFGDAELGTRDPGDDWVDALATQLVRATRGDGAAAVVAGLADGVDPEAVGEALSLAGTRLLLLDPGRSQAAPGKPVGSVHGASVGVHASDSALAWRGIARVCGARERAGSLIAGGYHTAGQGGGLREAPLAGPESAAEFAGEADGALVATVVDAVAAGDQARASAAAYAYGTRGADPAALFDVLRENALANDGALHAEKYFHTTRVVVAGGRARFRPEHLAALARVAASQNGFEAPGVARARELLRG